MSWLTADLAILAFAGFFAGLVDAIAGGGGLVTLPALLAVGLPPHLALATNKGQAVFGAFASSSGYWRRGAVDRKRAPMAFACGLVGSIAGAAAQLAMRPEVLRPVVIGMLMLAAVVVAWPRKARDARRRGPRLPLGAPSSRSSSAHTTGSSARAWGRC